MAREASITQEQVNAAAEALRAAGAKPTVRAVRERLGNVGSQATVMRMLDGWKRQQVQVVEAPVTLPAAFQVALADYVGQAVAEGKAALASDLAEQQQISADLALESERLGATIERLEQDLDVAVREREAVAGRAEQLEVDLGLARGEVEQERLAAEIARTELAKTQLRLEAMPRLEADLHAVREALELERAARVAAEQGAAVASARLEGEVRERQRIDAELQAVKGREEQASQRLQDAHREHVGVLRELAETRAELQARGEAPASNAAEQQEGATAAKGRRHAAPSKK
ncbi:hypothetical protein BKK79_36500 (plasmid) [Cupriavidus sp. USMAA2-4]|uniref:DNA-binding protein n=1 Tax=Cupriavidus sp. USMAA2-4 TaxID=876364 RepID=UPI0008A6FE07|nr:DNA-binding protein [Cupriavidus sp. USMAA2-4]AOY97451.1 hypothetical protein BKK79_36500 [Cupriavidus sp. USMAA2-4]